MSKVIYQKGNFKILKPLVVEILPEGRKGFLYSDFKVLFNDVIHTVPAGFITDFASIPKVAWSYAGPMGKYTYAAVIHDYYYVKGGHLLAPTKKDADKLFFNMIRTLGIRWSKAKVMYYSVRMFGRGNY